MKNQYFGDINDYFKYALLRKIAHEGGLTVFVCWMLTADDDRRDGNKTRYLQQPEKYRDIDPQLFDFLQDLIKTDRRDVTTIENASLIQKAQYLASLLTADRENQEKYFRELHLKTNGFDVVFFDPDNGLEVKSVPAGRKNSEKYLYWPEFEQPAPGGHSVIVYQHFPRRPRDEFISGLLDEVRHRVPSCTPFVIRLPHVVYLVAASTHHYSRLLAAGSAIGPVTT